MALWWCCLKKNIYLLKLNKKYMTDTIKDTIVGVSSIGVLETIPHVVDVSLSSSTNLIQVIIQIIVGVATLIRLFKKKEVINP